MRAKEPRGKAGKVGLKEENLKVFSSSEQTYNMTRGKTEEIREYYNLLHSDSASRFTRFLEEEMIFRFTKQDRLKGLKRKGKYNATNKGANLKAKVAQRESVMWTDLLSGDNLSELF